MTVAFLLGGCGDATTFGALMIERTRAVDIIDCGEVTISPFGSFPVAGLARSQDCTRRLRLSSGPRFFASKASDLVAESDSPTKSSGGLSRRRAFPRAERWFVASEALDVRQWLMGSKLPFVIITARIGEERVVLAIAHTRQEPRYWIDRVK